MSYETIRLYCLTLYITKFHLSFHWAQYDGVSISVDEDLNKIIEKSLLTELILIFEKSVRGFNKIPILKKQSRFNFRTFFNDEFSEKLTLRSIFQKTKRPQFTMIQLKSYLITQRLTTTVRRIQISLLKVTILILY